MNKQKRVKPEFHATMIVDGEKTTVEFDSLKGVSAIGTLHRMYPGMRLILLRRT